MGILGFARYIEGRSMDELIKMERAGLLQLSWPVKRKLLRQVAEVRRIDLYCCPGDRL